MRKLVEPAICLCTLFIVVLAIFPRQAEAGTGAQGCSIGIFKEAFPQEDVFFDFLAESSVGPDSEFSLAAGSATNVFLIPGESVVVSELGLEGWELIKVECDPGSGGFTVFVDDENNVIADCTSAGFVACTFTNKGSTNIPTLSEWGMIAAGAGLVLIGVFFVIRRKRAQVV